uniref:Interferon regulatory factor n=1 Tax=Poecilia formosa TaxID=48698 RepID=A0A096MAR0_POEFO
TMPVERMRMRPWLEEQINSCQIPGLKWVNKEKRIFQIPWMHAARHGWDLEKDAPLFMRWAIHTGKYQPGVDRPDPKTWKANFRCAMNSLPDIEEVKDKSIKKGTNAFRVYKMLSSTEKSLKKGKKKADKEGKSKLALKEETRELTVSNSGSGTAAVFCVALRHRSALDSLVFIPAALHSPAGDHLIHCEQLPDVCQTIEVTTENEDQTVSSSHSYPLQISPVSSCCGETPYTQTHPPNRSMLRGRLTNSQRNIQSKQVLAKVGIGRIPPCSLPGMASFVNPSKPNFRVTSLKDPTPLISYHIDSWTPACGQNSHTPPSSSHAHEVRASVIRKTSDVTSS